jgi:SlyX protein
VSEQRFEDLEIRLAYQDQMLTELNDVVTNQQARIMQLEQRVEVLLERLQSLGDNAAEPSTTDERPPHY